MHKSSDNPTHNGCAILIVEDHDELRENLLEWLKSVFTDCTFLVAGSGEKAVELADALHPVIVLMDIQLPGINGLEAIRRIKVIDPQTQVLILSVMDAAAYKEEAMAAGACEYISKNHMHAELIPAIIKLLPPRTAG